MRPANPERSVLSVRPPSSLRKRSEFLALRQSPRFSCDNFILQGNVTACEEGNTRIGYTITKKTGNSVERSRMKRRLRSAISKALGEIHEKAEIEKKEHLEICGDMVIVARRSSISEPHALLVSKLTKGIDRLLAKGNKAV